MLTCKEVARLVASEGLADAGWLRRLTARMHFLLCRHCRRYASQIRALGEMARSGYGAADDDGAQRRLQDDLLARVPGAGEDPAPPEDG